MCWSRGSRRRIFACRRSGAVLKDLTNMFDEQARSAVEGRESVEGEEESGKLEARIAELEAMRDRAAILYREETEEEWAPE